MRYLIANWKLYVDARRSAGLARSYARRFGGARYRYVTQVLCPSAPEIEDVVKAVKGTRILVGAQHADLAFTGAATGEVSVRDLKELGCRYVIVGHSEQRALGESDALIAKKLRGLTSALVPILCVGEPARIRRRGDAVRFVSRQIKIALKGFRGSRLFLAYEPIWAISRGGKTRGACSPVQAEAMRAVIEKTAKKLLPVKRTRLTLLYGGSVDGSNIGSYVGTGGFRGALVGFASTKPAEYGTMIRTMNGG